MNKIDSPNLQTEAAQLITPVKKLHKRLKLLNIFNIVSLPVPFLIMASEIIPPLRDMAENFAPSPYLIAYGIAMAGCCLTLSRHFKTKTRDSLNLLWARENYLTRETTLGALKEQFDRPVRRASAFLGLSGYDWDILQKPNMAVICATLLPITYDMTLSPLSYSHDHWPFALLVYISSRLAVETVNSTILTITAENQLHQLNTSKDYTPH